MTASAGTVDPMTNPARDARSEDRPTGLDYPDPRSLRHQLNHQVNPLSANHHKVLRRIRGASARRRMHLHNDQTSTSSTNNHPDYALTADLLAERTLDTLLAEHPGELVRTG